MHSMSVTLVTRKPMGHGAWATNVQWWPSVHELKTMCHICLVKCLEKYKKCLDDLILQQKRNLMEYLIFKKNHTDGKHVNTHDYIFSFIFHLLIKATHKINNRIHYPDPPKIMYNNREKTKATNAVKIS